MVVEIPPLRISLLALILVLVIPAFAQANERFIQKCESELNSNEKKWFQLLLNSSDCRIISNKISEMKSFEEVLPVLRIRTSFINTWAGIKEAHDHDISSEFTQDHKIKYHLFDGLDLFIGFENLKHISLHDRKFSHVCDVVRKFPQLETMTIETEHFYNQEVDDCLSEAPNLKGIYLRGSVHMAGDADQEVIKTRTKVLGIEYWRLPFSHLKRYPFAGFLHFANAPSVVGIEVLGSNLRLQNIVIESTSFPNLQGLGSLKELRSLTIKSSKIKDINFIRDLRWLKHVSFTDNEIRDVRPLESLKYLQSADISYNRIQSLPDLSVLKNLRSLNFRGSGVKNIRSLNESDSLLSLDLSENQISDFSSLEKLPTLEALNISANAPVKTLTVPPLPRLKVLAIDGASGYFSGGSFAGQSHLITENLLSERSKEYLQFIKGNYSNKCETVSSFNELSPLVGFDELEVLSLKDQRLDFVPDVSQLRNLRFLNLKGNSLESLSLGEAPASLRYVNVSENPIKNLFQDLPGKTELYTERLIKNFKCQVQRL